MNFYLSEVPFSRFGSYMALAELPDWWQGHKIEHGIYLKNVSGSTQNPIVAKFIFSGDELSADLDGGSLSLVSLPRPRNAYYSRGQIRCIDS